ncbi:MAG: pentapeptide repeat-containing protein [Deltaproteobacteria bacterium]|nr:pentapeptide repeat-containing protein [Deltaproteobacteria bacterium]
MSLLDLLMDQNVSEFNAKRGQRVTLDLFAADLANLSLAGVDLSGANLEKADFSGTDLTGANLSKATLVGADFTGAKLQRAIAIKAKLREAYLGGADLTEAELGGADLGEADLGGANLTRARLHGAKLREATLRSAQLDHADLGEAKLNSADLHSADLVGALLREADLSAANLDAANLEDADFGAARLGGATLRAARVIGTKLEGADLSGADLTGAVFDHTTVFDGADLTDTVLDELLSDHIHGGIRPPPAVAQTVDIHVDDPAVAQSLGCVGVLWPNAEGDEDEIFRLAIRDLGARPGPGGGDGTAQAVAVDASVVRARALLPAPGGFFVVFLVEKPGGTDLVVFEATPEGIVGSGKATRLGYTPAVLPNFVADGDGFFIYGIGRGLLSVHRWGPSGLAERLRAPASTIRGFCDRASPVVHSKGGTVMVIEPDGIGRAVTAPPDFPGRRFAAGPVSTEEVGIAWVKPEEKGFRLMRLGRDREPMRVDAGQHVGALDLRAVDGGWWVAWTREAVADRDLSMAMAAFLPEDGDLGKPFPLLTGDDAEDVEELSFVSGEGPVRVACVTIDEALVIMELEREASRVVARVGG